MKNSMLESLYSTPVITAVKNIAGIKKSAESDCSVVFILFGDICNIGELVDIVKSAGKIAIVHIDLIDGLSNKESAVKYIARNTAADGIISTKLNLIKTAKESNLITVQRVFILDSLSLENVKQHIQNKITDFIEILPGNMPKIIKDITDESSIPVIAGGLIRDKDDVISALGAGAIAVSTTNQSIWL